MDLITLAMAKGYTHEVATMGITIPECPAYIAKKRRYPQYSLVCLSILSNAPEYARMLVFLCCGTEQLKAKNE